MLGLEPDVEQRDVGIGDPRLDGLNHRLHKPFIAWHKGGIWWIVQDMTTGTESPTCGSECTQTQGKFSGLGQKPVATFTSTH